MIILLFLIFALLFFASPVMLVIGLLFPKVPSALLKRSLNRKQVAIIFICSTILFFILTLEAGYRMPHSTTESYQGTNTNRIASSPTVLSPTQPISPYSILYTTTDKDKNNQPYSMKVYTLETPIFPYDEGKITDVISMIKQKECLASVDCDIDLYDDKHFADESYAFDVAMDRGQSMADSFDKEYPDFENLDPHHLVVSYWASDDKIRFYPLITATNNNNTPTQGTGEVKAGNAGLYPDSSLTSGETFPNVTSSQVCVSGYSSSVRNVPESEKREVYAEYGISYPQPTGSYEVDHFIPLELGGDNSLKNLWPEPANPVPGFHQKDQVENYLHKEVCDGLLSLSEAQDEIKRDWYAVYVRMNPSATNPTSASTSTVSTTDTSNTGNSAGSQCTNAMALCNDGTCSYASSHRGACSKHGGVKVFYK